VTTDGERAPFDEVRVGRTNTLLGDEPVDLSDVLNTVLDRGAVVHGEVVIAVADIDLITLNIGLLLQAVASAEQRAAKTARARPVAAAESAAPGPQPRSGSLANTLGTVPHRGEPLLATPRPGKSSPADADPAYSTATTEPARNSLNAVAQGLPERINADAAGPESGLARLVLTLIEVLRKVLEHQAVRRMEGGRLTDEEIERLGLTLARLNERMGELKHIFGLSEEDLQIDLGPLGRLK
jgi:hypothetical protein